MSFNVVAPPKPATQKMRLIHKTHQIVVSVVKMQESPFETMVPRDDGTTFGKPPSTAVPADDLANVCLRSVLSPSAMGPTRTQPLTVERPVFSLAAVDTWILVAVALLAAAMGVSMFGSRRCQQSRDASKRPLGARGRNGKTDSPAQCRLRAFRGPMARIPGPWYTSWTSLVHTFHTLRGRGPVYVHSLHTKYGPVVRIGPREVDVSDPTAAQTIHNIKDGFAKAPWYLDSIVGDTPSVFHTIDPQAHARRWRILSQPLSEIGLRSVLPVIDERVQLAIAKMAGEMKKKGFVDVYKWCHLMTTDIIGLLSFGEAFGMLEDGEPHPYIEDLERLGYIMGVRMAWPFVVRLYQALPFLPFGGRLQHERRLERRTRLYAEASLARQQQQLLYNANPPPNLFGKVFSPGKGEEALTPKELIADAQGYILGGGGMTARTLTYLVWAVCRHADVHDRLVAELDALPQAFVDAEVRACSYLSMVVDETLRLWPGAPAGLPRTVPAGAGVELAEGLVVPAGAVVSTQAYSMHHDPDLFPDPDRFWPERWERPTKAMRDAFMPFGGTSRICLGLHLARMEIRLAAARFFVAFPQARVADAEGMGDADMAPDWYFVMNPRGKRCLIADLSYSS